jgi:DNA invertase Pin-like site-specific DNA recombinase
MVRWYYDNIPVDYTDEEFKRLEQARAMRLSGDSNNKGPSIATSKAMKARRAPEVRHIRQRIVDAVLRGITGQQHIADAAGVHRTTVKKNLNEMRELGIVLSQQRAREITIDIEKAREVLGDYN